MTGNTITGKQCMPRRGRDSCVCSVDHAPTRREASRFAVVSWRSSTNEINGDKKIVKAFVWCWWLSRWLSNAAVERNCKFS